MKKTIFAIGMVALGFISVCAQAENGSVFYQEVNWSPDGKSFSYSVYRKSDPTDKQVKSEIYIMKADGTNPQKISDDATWTSWSKDGKRILFSRSSADKKTSDLFTVKADGSEPIQLTKDAKRNSHPQFSPDGKRIVFTSTRDSDKNQLYVMNSDGTNIKRLTTDPAVGYFNPIWSPDSKKIVYYAEKGDQKDQIWTIKPDGSNQILLTGNVGHNTFPSFSPDGKSIIFNSTRDGEQAIYTMNSADGANLKRVAGIKSYFARYSPNGKKIAFIVGGFPKNDVYIADADGSNQVKITNKETR